MDMIPVVSSNINAIGYDDNSSTLRISFNDGSQYDYYSVTRDVFEAFRDSDSKGKFLHQNIKGKYPYARL